MDDELKAIQNMKNELDAMEPMAAKRVLQFVISDQEERLAKWAAQQGKRGNLPNQNVTQ